MGMWNVKTITHLDLAIIGPLHSKALLSPIQNDTIVQFSASKWIHTTEGTASFPTLCLFSWNRNLWRLCSLLLPSQHVSSCFHIALFFLMKEYSRTPTWILLMQWARAHWFIKHALCHKVTRDLHFWVQPFQMSIRDDDNQRVGRRCQSTDTFCAICGIRKGVGAVKVCQCRQGSNSRVAQPDVFRQTPGTVYYLDKGTSDPKMRRGSVGTHEANNCSFPAVSSDCHFDLSSDAPLVWNWRLDVE